MSDFPARVLVDLAAIRANVATLRRAAGRAEVMAVVKADAYGHGLVPASRAALAGGATWLGTAQVSEALALRAAGITEPRILSWLYAPGAPLQAAVEADVDLSVSSPGSLAAVAAAALLAGRPARVHLKIDTGLGRNGVMPDALADVLADALALDAEGALRVVGVWSHLARADEPAHPGTAAQVAVLDAAIAQVERAGVRLEVRHLANSAATLLAPEAHYDLVRPGIAVYGLSPVPDVASAADLGLVPAMTLEARLATVKAVPAGHGVSYGHVYRTPRATVLGDVPLGYGDGIPRHASGGPDAWGGPVLVGGRRLGVAGRVCMDQFMVDLGPDATEQEGDVVTLFGAGRDGGPTAQDWAEAAETISYEIVTRVGSRIPRTYVGGDPDTDAPRTTDRSELTTHGTATEG